MIEHRCLSPWKGAVVGGLIVFVWQALSWMALPFHNRSVAQLQDAAPIVHSLEASALQGGVYLLANDPAGKTAPTDPFLFVSYHKAGWGSMGKTMALSLLIQTVGAFFWTWILGKIPGLTLKDAALYGAFFGICVGVLGQMSNFVWWKFPFGFAFLYVVDAVAGWTLASLAISRCYAPACPLPTQPNDPA